MLSKQFLIRDTFTQPAKETGQGSPLISTSFQPIQITWQFDNWGEKQPIFITPRGIKVSRPVSVTCDTFSQVIFTLYVFRSPYCSKSFTIYSLKRKRSSERNFYIIFAKKFFFWRKVVLVLGATLLKFKIIRISRCLY